MTFIKYCSYDISCDCFRCFPYFRPDKHEYWEATAFVQDSVM